MDHEELPAWVAVAAAMCAPAEGTPSLELARDLFDAVVEYAALLGVSEWWDRGLPFGRRQREALSGLMEDSRWAEPLDALLQSGERLSLLGDTHTLLPDDHPVTRAWQELSGRSGQASIADLVGVVASGAAVPAIAGPLLKEAALAMAASMPGMTRWTLCQVRSVGARGSRLELRFRALLGTGWPIMRLTEPPVRPQVIEGELALWDGYDGAIVVPRWLAWFDEPRGVLRLLAGRDRQTGQVVYASRRPGMQPLFLSIMPGGAPPFLQPGQPDEEPGGLTVEISDDDLTADRPVERLHPATPPRSVDGSVEDLPDIGAPDELRTVMQVISGRDVFRFRELRGDLPLVIGRSAAHAELVIQHPKVSRRNTQISLDQGSWWVRDLQSTNGTLLNGHPVGVEPVRLTLGDVLQVGPSLVRIEQMPADELRRLDRVLRYPFAPDRDPLTGLLKRQALDARVQQGFAGARVGLVLHVDELSALQNARGIDLADMVWLTVARLVMLEVERELRQRGLPRPELMAELGYGEALVVLESLDLRGAADLAERLQAAVARQTWVPALEVTLTASVVEVEPGQPADDWIDRARQLAFLGRARRGPGRIHGAGRAGQNG